MKDERSALETRTLNELRESVGGDPEFLAELIDEFLSDAPRQLELLREAAAAEDAEEARRAAHSLRGNARTFGAATLAALCQEAESAAGAGDLRAVLARLEAIDAAWSEVRTELGAVRTSA